MAHPQQLLSPELLHTIEGLELTARIIVEGYMTGSNKSQSVGAGQEFSQYRNYEAGDDLRQLDWKMFARSERYYIKQADIETNITVKFMLDASLSMAYVENGISKFDYARVLVAALAFLARKQSDRIGLFAVNEKKITIVQPRFEQQQWMRFLSGLLAITPDGTWNHSSALEHTYHHHGKELIIFVTDLYDDAGDLQQFIGRLKTPRNEVIVFHLLGTQEAGLSYDGTWTFEDLETGVRVQADSAEARSDYDRRMQQWIADSRNWMLEKQIYYQLVKTGDVPQSVLRNFLTVRKKLMR